MNRITLPKHPSLSRAHQLILIENITAEAPTAGGFVRPTVIDLKLGTQMWDPDSSDEKRERMEKSVRETTSGRWGLRITGGKVSDLPRHLRHPCPLTFWQVWDAEAQQYQRIGKEVGKSLNPDGKALAETLARFFPIASSPSLSSGASPPSSAHISRSTMSHLISSTLVPAVRSVLDTVRRFDWRVYGSSLLVVYEGDPTALAARLEKGPEEASRVKMIDFAHAWEGEGPDKGLLKGFETVLDLLEQIGRDYSVSSTE